ncbi:MAG: sigma-54-dependent Fis family transcriptional regulator [Planctomycetes bacterium]|nr:sigma-54-dependent Fis family transcriptional regulator [Planctomycetota bacterium]
MAGSAAILYCIAVLGFVASSPDLGLRCLLVDEVDPSAPTGVRVWATGSLEFRGPAARPIGQGDLLTRVGPREMRHSLDLTELLTDLRSADSKLLLPGARFWEPGSLSYPWLVEEASGSRWVRIEFRPVGSDKAASDYLRVQSLPLSEVGPTFLWFVLQLGIFAVGGLAWWRRPFDRSARVFFAMCVVTLCAFVGGFHWWILASSPWLTAPFAVCAILLPAVTLHFFLVCPRARPPLATRPRTTLAALYAIPAAAGAAVLFAVVYMTWLGLFQRGAGAMREALVGLRVGAYVYFGIAAAYFLLALVSLRQSLRRATSPQEHRQLWWIWWGGAVATVFIAYSLYLALFRRIDFALGAARLPMFLASLAFMLAYAVAIVRHKLMLHDRPGDSLMYYVVSSGLTLGFGAAVALFIVAPRWLNIAPSSQQAFWMAMVLALSAIGLLWVRDRMQQRIDRRFFREKYRLDEALQRMNSAVGRLRDPQALAEMMLSSCREVLSVERAAVYFRTNGGGALERISTYGMEDAPPRLAASGPLMAALAEGESLQRVTASTRRDLSGVQQALHDLRVELVHPLQSEGEISGIVVLGGKPGGNQFTAEDLTFLNAVAQVTNVALASGRAVEGNLARMNDELRARLEKIGDQRRQIELLQNELAGLHGGAPPAAAAPAAETFRREIIRGHSPAIERVLETVRKVASSESSVLIRGESGTGKELLAQVLHDNGRRRSGPLVSVHCAALSPSLLESELFGHVKGAFTGAHRDKIGRFEAADGGTLFLDEIGDISLDTQVKLLRVLQERCFEPVGGSRTIHVDVRLITATHQDLEAQIAAGRFREDLYYRLNVISITLPSLRERREDIFELALFFLRRGAERSGKRIAHIDEDALAALERYPWPGNVRELENAIERAVVLAEGERVTLDALPPEVAQATVSPGWRPARARRRDADSRIADRSAGADVVLPETSGLSHDGRPERAVLEEALVRCAGNKAQAARLLDMPRSTFFSKLKKHGLG